ncbi:hypothetical protein Pth03_44850 [Planotetraspora thailandica]|uniref:Uncharacterized protein n=1 Tax=Planotetraspora thailandica TaxID=487172 RepID=A0A8J3V3G7_9ACTN|nr:DUF6000 family protein [Planotetraspora thailandica]GII56096.1 hypothetical protein Pth03_44850 [Planotetraspora thailandica]
MTTDPDEDPEIRRAIQRYVVWDRDEPRYLKLLGGKLPKLDDRFKIALADDSRQISDGDLDKFLCSDWRPRLTAAWLIGLDRRIRYRQAIGKLLLDSEVVYAGRGYCFALANFGQPEDAEILTAYLERYLPRTDCHYDQHWAIGALLHLDDQLGTYRAHRFLATGLWEASAFSRLDPATHHRVMTELCDTASTLAQDRPGSETFRP